MAAVIIGMGVAAAIAGITTYASARHSSNMTEKAAKSSSRENLRIERLQLRGAAVETAEDKRQFNLGFAQRRHEFTRTNALQKEELGLRKKQMNIDNLTSIRNNFQTQIHNNRQFRTNLITLNRNRRRG